MEPGIASGVAATFYCTWKYRVISKKVSSGISRIIMVSKEEKNFAMESKDHGLPLSKF